MFDIINCVIIDYMNKIINNNKNILETIFFIIFIIIFIFLIYLGFREGLNISRLDRIKINNEIYNLENFYIDSEEINSNKCASCNKTPQVYDSGLELVNKDTSNPSSQIKFKVQFNKPPKIFTQITGSTDNTINFPFISILEKTISTSGFQYVVRAISNEKVSENNMKMLTVNNGYNSFSFYWIAIEI